MTEKKEFTATLDRFHEYLFGVQALYQNAIPILKEQFEAILHDNIPVLNDRLKSHQALLLQTKNFEKNVSEYLANLNIQANTLTEMIQQLPNEQQHRFYEVLGQFQQTIAEVNFYKEKCRVLLQSKLYNIDKVLSGLEVQKETTMYNQNATEVQGTLIPKSFETKV